MRLRGMLLPLLLTAALACEDPLSSKVPPDDVEPEEQEPDDDPEKPGVLPPEAPLAPDG